MKKHSLAYHKKGYPNHKYFKGDEKYPKRKRALKKIEVLEWSEEQRRDWLYYEKIADLKYTQLSEAFDYTREDEYISDNIKVVHPTYVNWRYKHHPRWRARVNMQVQSKERL